VMLCVFCVVVQRSEGNELSDESSTGHRKTPTKLQFLYIQVNMSVAVCESSCFCQYCHYGFSVYEVIFAQITYTITWSATACFFDVSVEQ